MGSVLYAESPFSPLVVSQCVPYSSPNAPSKATLSIIKEYPEIEQVIYPEGQRPLYMLQTNDTYTQVVADRVLDASNASHTVLYLGTGR